MGRGRQRQQSTQVRGASGAGAGGNVTDFGSNAAMITAAGIEPGQTDACAHTVVEGDTTWDIVRDHGGDPKRWRELRALNPGQNLREIHPDDELQLCQPILDLGTDVISLSDEEIAFLQTLPEDISDEELERASEQFRKEQAEREADEARRAYEEWVAERAAAMEAERARREEERREQQLAQAEHDEPTWGGGGTPEADGGAASQRQVIRPGIEAGEDDGRVYIDLTTGGIVRDGVQIEALAAHGQLGVWEDGNVMRVGSKGELHLFKSNVFGIEMMGPNASAEMSVGNDGFTVGGTAGLLQGGYSTDFEGDAEDDNELDGRLNLSLGMGLAARGHWGDADGDGGHAIGFGFDAGPVSIDIKDEDVVRTVVPFDDWIFGEEGNLTGEVLDWF